MEGQAVQVETITPILRVKDMAVSKAFYIDVLGFADLWGDDNFGAISRDGRSIYLSKEDQGDPGSCWVWIGVEDLDMFYEACKASGAEMRQEPTNLPGLMRCRSQIPTATYCESLQGLGRIETIPGYDATPKLNSTAPHVLEKPDPVAREDAGDLCR